MIAWLKGNVVEKSSNKTVLDVNGVGYDINISMNTYLSLPDIGQVVSCFVQTIVREDNFSLYGFSTKKERHLFQILIKVSGIGPKVALGILSSISVNDLITILQNKDSKNLIRLPGIGKKTAERLIIELTDQLTKEFKLEANISVKSQAKDEAIQALVSLGYALKKAEQVIVRVDDGEKSADELIRSGLKSLSPA